MCVCVSSPSSQLPTYLRTYSTIRSFVRSFGMLGNARDGMGLEKNDNDNDAEEEGGDGEERKSERDAGDEMYLDN